MALLKSRISENSTEHHIMKMTNDQIATHVYIHTTIYEGPEHEEHLKIVKRDGQHKRVHKLELDKSSETLYNWRKVDSRAF